MAGSIYLSVGLYLELDFIGLFSPRLTVSCVHVDHDKF